MLLSPSFKCCHLLPRYPASTSHPPGSSRCRVPFHCCPIGVTQSLKKLSPIPAPTFVKPPLVGPSFAPRGRFNPNGNGLDMVANGTPPPSTEAVNDVLPRKPSVPELPETPAACMTETPYKIPYAPRKTV